MTTQGYFDGHLRQNMVGAVNPQDGQLVSLIVSHNDNWHEEKGLEWHQIKPIYLPPYSRDDHPIERLWQYLKGHCLAGYLMRNGEVLCQKIDNSLRDMMGKTELMKSVCTPKNL